MAGTNGKGSVIAFLRSILEAGGLSVHVYTSPHLIRFSERIVVAGAEIGEDELVGLLEECEAANGEEPITFFEITTAAAFLAFARTPADVTLLETGLGGRLDATNVIDAPLLTLLTLVSLDHQAFLGDTIEQIAGEKAGILKSGVPCMVAAQRPEAAQVIRARAEAIGAPLAWEGTDWSTRSDAEGLIFDSGGRSTRYPLPGLRGAHQFTNAGVAVASIRHLAGLDIGDEAIAAGLQRATWPARLQCLDGGRLRALVPQDWELWLDGGHNPAAGAALADHARTWSDKPLYLVFGGLKNKDAEGILAPLAPYTNRLVTVAIPGQERQSHRRRGGKGGRISGDCGRTGGQCGEGTGSTRGGQQAPRPSAYLWLALSGRLRSRCQWLTRKQGLGRSFCRRFHPNAAADDDRHGRHQQDAIDYNLEKRTRARPIWLGG